MTLFFFDIADTGTESVDSVGSDVADLQQARNQALATLGEIARDELPDGDRREFAITIRDESGPRIKASLVLDVRHLT